MSNLNQFIPRITPEIGVGITLPYLGTTYDPGDGSLWIASTGTAPFNYTSDYSYLPDTMLSPHELVPGPESDGSWLTFAHPTRSDQMSIAVNAAAPLYVTSAYGYDAQTSSFYYYTSTDLTMWTKRYFPTLSSGKTYGIIAYVNSTFLAIAPSTTTNGVITSTDGVNWTTSNSAVSFSSFGDIISNGTNIVVTPSTSTGAMYSTNSGTTWSTATLSTSIQTVTCSGTGVITWNSGAGLFIAATNTAGTYMTSPTGQTWTSVATEKSFRPYNFSTTTKFASNATTTIAVSNGGLYAHTTDGLNWTNHGYIPNAQYNFGPNNFYHDGTRFVVRFAQRIFYSTDGISWTEGKQVGGLSSASVSNGIMFGFPTNPSACSTKMLKISDVTATTSNTVISSSLALVPLTTMTYVRIR